MTPTNPPASTADGGAYTPDQRRVCDYLIEIMPNVGCGLDVVGFLIASHAALQDKIEGLDSDLFQAVSTAYHRGAVDWTRLNYPKWFERLSVEPPKFDAITRKDALAQPGGGRVPNLTGVKAALIYARDRLPYNMTAPIRGALADIDALSAKAAPVEVARDAPHETPDFLLKYAQDLATVAAKKCNCVPEWKPFDDIGGCLTQIDNCLTGLVATPPAEKPAVEEWVMVPRERVEHFRDWLERTRDERNFPAHLFGWCEEADRWLGDLLAAAPTPTPGRTAADLLGALEEAERLLDNGSTYLAFLTVHTAINRFKGGEL